MEIPVGFLNWNPSWGRISRSWNPFSDIASDCKIRNRDLNPDSPIEHILCQTRGRLFKVPCFSVNCRGQSSSLIGCHPKLLWRAKTGKSRNCLWGRTEGLYRHPSLRTYAKFRRSTSTITAVCNTERWNEPQLQPVWVPNERFLDKFNNH